MDDKYSMSAITHLNNRVNIYLYNSDTEECYNIDFTQEDLEQFYQVIKQYRENGDFERIY